MCERSNTLQHPTYQLRDLLVLLDDVSHRLSQARPTAHLDEVIASVEQHRQMVARWLANPPSRTVQANAASTILSVIASANAAAHAAHFDAGSWRPVQAELRAAQHSHPDANVPLYFDLEREQGRGIANAVLNEDLVPTPLDWLPKAGTRRVCEIRVVGIEEPLVLVAECVGIETPDGVLLNLVPASMRQKTRLQALAAGEYVETRSSSRHELPTLTEDQILSETRRNRAAARALTSTHPAVLPPATAAPATLEETTREIMTVEAPTVDDRTVDEPTSEELIFTEPVLLDAFELMDAIEDDPATMVSSAPDLSTMRPAPLSPVEALLEQYCSDLEETTAQTRVEGRSPCHADDLPPTQPPPAMDDAAWRTPITMPPTGLVAMNRPAPRRAPPARVRQPIFAPTASPETQPPPPLAKTQPPPPMPMHGRINTLVSPQSSALRPVAKTQDLSDLGFANAPVGAFAHHSDVAHMEPIRQQPIRVLIPNRETPIPTVVSIEEAPRPVSRHRRGGALLLAASIALGLFASPSPNPTMPGVARSLTPATTAVVERATSHIDVADDATEMVSVKRSLVRKLRD